jgi:Universal stress protein family
MDPIAWRRPPVLAGWLRKDSGAPCETGGCRGEPRDQTVEHRVFEGCVWHPPCAAIRAMYRRIVVGVDETDSAARAVREALTLAREAGAEVLFSTRGRECR